MNYILRITLPILLIAAVFLLPAGVVQAAPQAETATLKLVVNVIDKDFWNCTFITKTNSPAKPALVKASWSFGDLGKGGKSVPLIQYGNAAGEVSIVAEKGSVVNLDVVVVNAKGSTLGIWGMQLINKGQQETIRISLPEEFQPVFTRSDM